MFSKCKGAAFEMLVSSLSFPRRWTKKPTGWRCEKNGKERRFFLVQSSAVKVYIDIAIDELHDPSKIAEDCTKVGHWTTSDSRFKIRSVDEIPYGIELIKQSYNRNKA
jgi:predicted transport protein